MTVFGDNWRLGKGSIYAFSGEKNPEGARPLTIRQAEGSSRLGRGNVGYAERGAAPLLQTRPANGDQGTSLVEGRHRDIRGSFVFLRPQLYK